MSALARAVRGMGFGLAVLAGVVAVLVVFNAAVFGPVAIQRLREPTLAIWLGLLVVVLVSSDRAALWERWTSKLETWLGSASGLRSVVAVGGMLILASSLTQHLAFNTYLHDLGIYQEALANAWHDPPLMSATLGSSFLGEHFSPVLFLIAPLYQLFPSPLTLVILNALLLWVGVFVLRAVARELEVTPSVANLICLVYLFFPVVARSAGYPFHHEVLYPVVLFGLYLAFLRDRKLLGALLVMAAISIKEDAGLYLVGMGVFMGLHHRRWRWGGAVAAVGAVSTLAAVLWIIPHFASGGAGYSFHGRWTPWLDPTGIPGAVRRLVAAVFTEDVITVVAATVLIPFRGRWTWTVVAIPFALNLTSSTAIQAQLGLYYGLPVAATAAIASVAALALQPLSRGRAVKVAAAAVAINVAALTYPSIPSTRGEVLAELAAIDDTASVAMSASFDPLLQRVERRESLRAGVVPTTDYALVKTDRFTWPLSREEAAELAALLEVDGEWERFFSREGFAFFRRRITLSDP